MGAYFWLSLWMIKMTLRCHEKQKRVTSTAFDPYQLSAFGKSTPFLPWKFDCR